jgi:hypothetical protein
LIHPLRYNNNTKKIIAAVHLPFLELPYLVSMKNSMILKITEPCHENWENMMEAEKGRFCNVCSKDVVDFTRFTDAEVIEYFQGYKSKKSGNICGRFKSKQIDVPLKKIEVPLNSFYKLENSTHQFLWMMLFIIGVFSVSCNENPTLGKVETPIHAAQVDSSLNDEGQEEKLLMGDTVIVAPPKKIPVQEKLIKGEVMEEIQVMGEPMIMGGITIPENVKNEPVKVIEKDTLKKEEETFIKGKIAIDVKK